MKRIGFFGLGAMGLPIVRNILKKFDGEVMVFDVVEERLQLASEAGAIAVQDKDLIFNRCDVIITSLPTQEIVKNTLEEAIAKCNKGTLLIDLSSTAPEIIKELYKNAKERGMDLLDSPISGGVPKAEAATLAIMVGGDRDVYDKAEFLLQYIGSPVYVGESSSGNVAKLVNNVIAGGYLISMFEGYAFAVKAGLDPAVVFEATRKGFAGGPLYNNKIPKMYNRDFDPDGRIAVHLKDLRNAREFAESLGVDLSINEEIINVMGWMEERGLENEDQAAMIKYYEEKMKVFVREVSSSKN